MVTIEIAVNHAALILYAVAATLGIATAGALLLRWMLDDADKQWRNKR